MILIDNKPLRRKAINKCKYILKRFECVITDLDQFDRLDNPAFQQWLHATFGLQLTEIRQLQEKRHFIEDLLNHIEYLHLLEHLSYHEAYQKACDMRDNPEKYLEDEPDDEEDPWEDEHDEDDFDNFSDDNFDKYFQEFMRNIFGSDEFDFDSIFEDEVEDKGVDFELRGDDREEGQLKSIYRLLAKKLHPDSLDSTNLNHNELWYQVQDAYQRGNLEELEILQAGFDVRNTRGYSGLSISSILAVHKRYKEELRLLRRRHREIQKHSAWCFTELPDQKREQLQDSIDFSITVDIRETQSYVNHLEAKINKYSEPPTTRHTVRKKTFVSEKQLSLFD